MHVSSIRISLHVQADTACNMTCTSDEGTRYALKITLTLTMPLKRT